MTGTVFQKLLLALTVFVGCLALGLSIFAVSSSAWQTVILKEIGAEHYHGLWRDCSRNLPTTDSPHFSEFSCIYKFDSSAQEAIVESIRETSAVSDEQEHHLLAGWQKLLLIIMTTSQGLLLLAICMIVFTPICCRPYPFLFMIALLAAALLSLGGDVIFFFTSMRVDVRFAEGAIGQYEQQTGLAFYCHLGSTVLLFITLAISVCAGYSYFKRRFGSSDRYATEEPGPTLLEKYSEPRRPSPQQPLVREYAYHVTST